MASSFFTGVTGLQSHQRWLDVLAENLGNLNTTGYKAQRLLFSDILNHTVRAVGPPAGTASATNPSQLGIGVRVSSIDNVLQQGSMRSTGNSLDLGIEGNGFFMVEGGTQTLFTRAGSFTIDLAGYLVDATTGGRVQRFGTVGEAAGAGPVFQTAGDADIRVDFSTGVPGLVTTQVTLEGNLDALATGPRREMLSSDQPFAVSGVPATTASLLNALDTNLIPYLAGDSIGISGTEVDGSAVNVTFAVDVGSTVGDLLTATSNAFTSATASLDAAGNLTLLADDTGLADLTLSLEDSGSNTGDTDFAEHTMAVSVVAGEVQEGKEGDTVTAAIEVYDALGSGHALQLVFTKQTDQEWSLRAFIDPTAGTLIDDQVEGIAFDSEGMLQGINGVGTGDSDVEVQFTGAGPAQTIALNFGTPGTSSAMTHFTGFTTASAANQNGFATGTLNEVSTDADGTVQGIFTNGQIFPVAQVALANFSNPEVLERLSSNFFGVSVNSGPALISAPLTGQSGAIQSGVLENSNVDQPLQMTRLIQAQRGFQANARSLTVQTELMQEAINLVG